jgi:hypothetical protein
MALKKRTLRKRKTYKKKGGSKKLAVPRSLGVIPQYCRIQETVDQIELIANESYAGIFQLSSFKRASAVATNFRFYRPAKVIWTYEPKFNTFQQSATGDTIGMPYLYIAMNRTQDNNIATLEDIQAQGSRPMKFSSKKVISYVPNWCSPGLMLLNNNQVSVPGGGTAVTAVANLAVQGLKAEYGFQQCPNNATIAANANAIVPTEGGEQGAIPGGSNQTMIGNYAANTVYNGHDVWIQQDNALNNVTVCKVSITVIWEFKGASYVNVPSEEAPAKKIMRNYNHATTDGF